MKRLFKISSGEHGKGKVMVKWQPQGNLLATAGQNGEVNKKIPVSMIRTNDIGRTVYVGVEITPHKGWAAVRYTSVGWKQSSTSTSSSRSSSVLRS